MKLLLSPPWSVGHEVVVNSTMGEDSKALLIPPWARVQSCY